jgi:predicted transcriptional regulator
MDLRHTRAATIGKILIYLVEEGPANKYDIKENARAGSQPTVLSTVDFLHDLGFISAKRLKKKSTGKQSDCYDLTIDGLMLLLSVVRYVGRKALGTKGKRFRVSYLAERQLKLLPRIFGLWNKFEAAGVADLAERHLLDIACREIDPVDLSWREFAGAWRASEKPHCRADRIEESFFSLGLARRGIGFDDVGFRRWLKALTGDVELRRLLLGSLEKQRQAYIDQLKTMDRYIDDISTGRAKKD